VTDLRGTGYKGIYSMFVDFPEMEFGRWSIRHHNDDDGGKEKRTCLYYDDTIVMDDSLPERCTHEKLINEIIVRRGRILMTGFGLGLVPGAVLPFFDDVVFDVVEIDKAVAGLAKSLAAKYPGRLNLIIADAFTYVPERNYAVIWHDPWTDQFNKEEARKLIRRYAPFADWQGFWRP
jgi:hypothetical protein